jgi:translation initiation factor 1 (eIF-1/SUI1)
LHSPYRLTLPHLSQLEPLIGIRLKGPFAATGTVKAGKTLDIQGQSTSLGGTTHYRYHGSRLEARLQGVPLPRLLRLADQPEKFLGTVNGTVSYDTHSHQGEAAVRIDRFQFKPGKLTTAVKLVLRKDLAQIIYDRSDLKARFNGDIIDYTLTAKGKRSDFSLEKGRLNTQARTHQARFALRIDQTDVEGTVRGPIKDPKISVIPGKLMREKLKKKVIDKIAPGIQKKINKATGGAVGNVLKKLPKLF